MPSGKNPKSLEKGLGGRAGSGWDALGQASMAGLTLAACIFVGVGLGIVIDRWLHTKPAFTLALMALGIVAGFVNVFRILAALTPPQGKK